MTPIRKYATFAVALAVLVAGYININRVYATQCDGCDNPKVLSSTAQNGNSTSNASTNSASGNGTTLGIGASNNDTLDNSSSQSDIDTGITQDESTTTDSTSANRYQMRYETISATCTQLANQYSASITNLVNFTNSLPVNQQAIATQILGIAELQVADMDNALKALDEAQTQSGLKTFFLGPDYSQLIIAKQVWQRNQLRIQELVQIQSQLSNKTDSSNLETQITTLEQQNESLSSTLENQTKIFSIFGWANRLISQY